MKERMHALVKCVMNGTFSPGFVCFLFFFKSDFFQLVDCVQWWCFISFKVFPANVLISAESNAAPHPFPPSTKSYFLTLPLVAHFAGFCYFLRHPLSLL
jgi:hypothetical protein